VQPPPTGPRRSFSGPIVLVIIGLVFLLGNMGVLRWSSVGYWFAHYWPVLLIIAGLIKLVEYQQAQRTGTRASGIGVGGGILIILLIAAGLVATQASRFNWEELRDHINVDDGDLPFFGHSYSYDDQQQQAFPADGSLHVVNDRGAVVVSPSDDDQIHVTVSKKVRAESQSEADKWNGQTKTQITANGNTITVNANTQGAGDQWVNADLTIALPRKASVNVSTRHGDVNITSRDGDVNVSSQHGDVNLSDVTGAATLNLDNSSARITNMSSDVTVSGHSNDVSIEDVKGGVHLSGEFMESVKLSHIEKGVTLNTSRTDMGFAKLGGDLDLDSSDLHASDVVGPLHLSTRSKDIHLDGVQGDVRVQNENGSVELRITQLGSVQVENRSDDIQLYLPDKSGFVMDAHARNGEIQSDFSEINVQGSDDDSTAKGTVNGGGPHVVIQNEHGGIEIRKGSAAPAPEPAPAPMTKPAKPAKPPRPGSVPQPTEN
jgi:hypothetical protein